MIIKGGEKMTELKWYRLNGRKWREENGYTTEDWKEYSNYIGVLASMIAVGYFILGILIGTQI